jgi:hypothetical protein
LQISMASALDLQVRKTAPLFAMYQVTPLGFL